MKHIIEQFNFNKNRIVFEANFPNQLPQHGYIELDGNEFRSEDGGCAKIASIGNKSSEIHVDIISWDEDEMEHQELSKFLGKKVRITIETI
jgi:hypothetical protein